MKLKRFTAALTAAACSAVMLSSLPVELSAGAATIFSNDFEINYGGWYAESPDYVAELTAVNGAGYEGSRGMLVTGRTSPSDGVSSSKDLYLEGGKRYDYSVRVFCETDQTFRLTLLTVDIDSGKETVKELDCKFVKGGTWAELGARYKAPNNSKEFKMTITTDSTDDFYFDDVKVIGKAEIVAQAAEKGLKDMLVNFGIRSGNILNGQTIGDSGIKSRLLKDCNAIECENETKPEATIVQNGSTDTNVKVTDSSFAKIASWCADNGLAFRGHTLVWHSQTKDWFFKTGFSSNGNWVSTDVMDQRMESYIKNMFALYKNNYPNLNLYAYDVCN
ncbi:MAG: endo-1,4-beta-xylanase, partial [Oscillospiraceae bacterium]|nr:endo-1,4-beta-xylanase [Oscillospiraceae bacterium]